MVLDIEIFVVLDKYSLLKGGRSKWDTQIPARFLAIKYLKQTSHMWSIHTPDHFGPAAVRCKAEFSYISVKY